MKYFTIGAKIKGNTFVNAMREPRHTLWPKMNKDALVVLSESKNISFANNKVITPGSFMKEIVNLGPNVLASGVESGFSTVKKK